MRHGALARSSVPGVLVPSPYFRGFSSRIVQTSRATHGPLATQSRTALALTACSTPQGPRCTRLRPRSTCPSTKGWTGCRPATRSISSSASRPSTTRPSPCFGTGSARSSRWGPSKWLACFLQAPGPAPGGLRRDPDRARPLTRCDRPRSGTGPDLRHGGSAESWGPCPPPQRGDVLPSGARSRGRLRQEHQLAQQCAPRAYDPAQKTQRSWVIDAPPPVLERGGVAPAPGT